MPKENNNIRMPCDENERFAIKPSIIYAPRIKPLTRAKKVEIHEVKANLKVQLPALTPTGVRRYRVPHHETVLLELKEAGFQEAEDYFKQVYEHEAKSINLETKRLKEQRHLIERIKYGLVNAELAKRANKPMEQTIQMLETALFFQSLMPEWFWIADKVFQSALKISTEIVEDDGEMLNIVKYIYGTFLFHKVKDARSAFTLLDEARKASEGKRWNASKILKAKQWPLFQESNLILNEVLIALAEQSKDEDPNLAVKILIDAIERASDSGDEEHLAKALYEAAKMQLSADNISEALQNFSKYLAIVETIPDPNGVCNGYKELASVYKVLKDVEGVKRHLVSFKEHAEKSGLAARLADAHYCLGEFELEQGRPSSATPHLTFAFESYKKLEMVKEMDKARFLAGVSKGEELKTSYLAMIEKCKENDAEAFRKLLEWTHRRTPFWTL
ncbi:uncharacterized protein LOC107037144 [Diachasma alloeum]|uniref:uncharacterized protein LOC107037144 n=1 Tax=Diachasma alloeum TaxID=454923 RepID=UPI0007384478|nr:uncharacterized protein LOC107037144 [Diachasma alloeum]